jgi:signal transduction histidine kinase
VGQTRRKASPKVSSGSSPRNIVERLRRVLARERTRRKEAAERERDALEQQKATADILKVISASPSDVQPVFDSIAESCVHLFGGLNVVVTLPREGNIELAAFATKQGLRNREQYEKFFPLPLNNESVSGRAMLSGKVVHVRDVQADAALADRTKALATGLGYRDVLCAPMIRDQKSIGAISVVRAESQIRPYTTQQIELLRTFANQGVIAAENVRLLNETKEALDQHQASAEVLQVISSALGETKPVFDKILDSCQRLFAGRHVWINLVGEDGAVHLAAYMGNDRPTFESIDPLPLTRDSESGKVILERRVAHYPNVERGADVPLHTRRGCGRIGVKSALIAPMLWKGRGIGTIFVGRASAGAFSEKEIRLLTTFADQAVIAIHNARLFQALEEKSRQLDLANQHKSAFLANMSHELRTPLNAVIGFARMLAARYYGDLTDKQAEYVNDIVASGQHLLALINDILDLSKIEAGRTELQTIDFDLRTMLAGALTQVRERAQRGGISLRLDTDPALAQWHGDERKLKQVLLNLLTNAVKFTPRGCEVRVHARLVDRSAHITVSDTGIGIAPADLEVIFEPFRQAASHAPQKVEGTGLGLALARRFVELHRGTLCVESEPGKGSTFTITLPVLHGE